VGIFASVQLRESIDYWGQCDVSSPSFLLLQLSKTKYPLHGDHEDACCARSTKIVLCYTVHDALFVLVAHCRTNSPCMLVAQHRKRIFLISMVISLKHKLTATFRSRCRSSSALMLLGLKRECVGPVGTRCASSGQESLSRIPGGFVISGTVHGGPATWKPVFKMRGLSTSLWL
jgi:hypothetical protein